MQHLNLILLLINDPNPFNFRRVKITWTYYCLQIPRSGLEAILNAQKKAAPKEAAGLIHAHVLEYYCTITLMVEMRLSGAVSSSW